MPRERKNYIPRADGEFSAWVQSYYDALAQWWVDSGFDPSELGPLKDALELWLARYPAHVAAQAAAEAARQGKDAARVALEAQVRPITNFVQGNPWTTDADRARMGISVPTGQRTPSPTPTTRPMVSVDSAARLTHELRLVDEGSPTRRGKPSGVVGAEVWVGVVEAGEPTPTDPGQLAFLALATRGKVRATFVGGDGGKTAVYMTRWVNTRGEKGPWSEVATATVAA